MALIECKGCGKQISDKAQKCPHCGRVLMENVQTETLKIIICEECKTSVPSGTETCPTCGCPITGEELLSNKEKVNTKKSIFKRWWFWCLIIVVLILILSLSGNEENDNENVIETVETSTESDIIDNSLEIGNEVEEDTVITAVDFYKWVDETDMNMEYTIPEKALTFIDEHPEFFPGSDKNTGAMSDYVDWEVTYQHITKNPSKYTDKLISVGGTIVDCYETESEYGTITFLQMLDEYSQSTYCLYYWGSLENTFENNYAWGYALPFGVVKFENMGGYYTEGVVCAACYIFESSEEYE